QVAPAVVGQHRGAVSGRVRPLAVRPATPPRHLPAPQRAKLARRLAVGHGASTRASDQMTSPLAGKLTPLGSVRPSSAYSSTTAARASRAFANASANVSPSVTNSGRAGDVTVNPPSG